jgi:hypothetical protein
VVAFVVNASLAVGVTALARPLPAAPAGGLAEGVEAKFRS